MVLFKHLVAFVLPFIIVFFALGWVSSEFSIAKTVPWLFVKIPDSLLCTSTLYERTHVPHRLWYVILVLLAAFGASMTILGYRTRRTTYGLGGAFLIGLSLALLGGIELLSFGDFALSC